MDVTSLVGIYGTEEPPAASRRLVAGPLAVELAGGAVRSVVWKGIEVLRGIDYPVRTADWGTYGQTTIDEAEESDGTTLRYRRHFSTADSAIRGTFMLEGGHDSLEARLSLEPLRPVAVNRAGFVLLHPVAGVAGSPLAVTHSNGDVETTHFPTLISPSQPVFDISALTQSANGVTVEIVFGGEVFEMEDQRNWSDASYKTYCRPLALPSPYQLAPGDPVSQSIVLRFSGAGAARAAGDTPLRLTTGAARLPEVTLSVEAGWEASGPAIEALNVAATRVRLDLTTAQWREWLAPLTHGARGAIDLELVVPETFEAIEAVLTEVAHAAETLDLMPRMVIALPAAYLKSYQPDARWPGGATPEQAAAAVRRHFPQSQVLGGMLTNFTELNRYRGAASAGDAVTHGTTAIVHAADDVSVMQTLEAMPQIFRSAAALAPQKPYHLGLVTIGMRSNPYGAGLVANPDAVRRPMAEADPRQRGLFAAAFMVGAMAATQATAVAGLSLAAPSGPMGLVEPGRVRPAYHVFRALAALAGAERLAVTGPAGIAGVAGREADRITLVLANLTAERRTLPLPASARVLVLIPEADTHDWLDSAPPVDADSVTLDAYGVAFVELHPSAVEPAQ